VIGALPHLLNLEGRRRRPFLRVAALLLFVVANEKARPCRAFPYDRLNVARGLIGSGVGSVRKKFAELID
jgi:hypothetical protein